MGRLVAALAACCLLNTAALAAAPLEAYGRLPALDLVALSPSGERVAYLATSGTTRRLIVRAVGGAILDSIELGDDRPRSIDWAGDDHVVYQNSTTEQFGLGEWHSAEAYRAFVLNVSTKDILPVFKYSIEVKPIEGGYYGARLIDGHWYGFFRAVPRVVARDIDNRTTVSPKLYRVDLDSGTHSRVIAAAGWAIGADGRAVVHGNYDPLGETWTLDLDESGHHLVSIDAPFAEAGLLGLGRKPGTAIYERLDRPDGTLWELPLTGDSTPVSLANEPAARPIFAFDGRAVGIREEGDVQQLHLFDPVMQKKANAVIEAFKPSVVEITGWSANFDKVLVETSGAEEALGYYVVDIPGQKVTPLGNAYPALGAGQIATPRIFAYKAADGTALQGVLTVPPGPEVKNRPLLVLPHGGPELRSHLGFDGLAQAFAAQGYVVFQPNYRGSGGFGQAFRAAGFGALGGKMQIDISDGVAELSRQGIADAKRACILGFDYGGYAALAGVTVQQGLYRCAEAIGGVTALSDMLTWGAGRYGRFDASMRILERRLGANSVADTAIDTRSPASLAAKADAPILLIYGIEDTVVPVSQSETMAKALQAAGKPVKLVVLPQEDHGLTREATRLQALQESIAFVEKYNPPG